MKTFKLIMLFKNTMNKTATMTIPDIRPESTQVEALAVMDTILSANIFRPGGFDYVSKVDCKKVETTETDFYDEP